MKIKITMKDPDKMIDAVQEAIEDADDLPDDAEEAEAVCEIRANKIKEAITSKWMSYGEYLTVEYDTEADTMAVLTMKESGFDR